MPAGASHQKSPLGLLNQIPDKSKPAGLSLFADNSESFHDKNITESKNTTIPKTVLQPKSIIGTNREASKISTRSKT